MKRPDKMILLLFMIAVTCIACSDNSIQASREKWLDTDGDEIVFGMSYPVAATESNTGFLNGVSMAVNEVNKVGILGKKLQIDKKDDEGAVTVGSEVAQSFVDDPRISVVIGHWNSRVTNAVADIYNRNKMVMVTPASTSPTLTAQGYQYVFTTINNDKTYGGTMARYSAEYGLDRVVICYADDDYGLGLANAFEDAAIENGIQVVDRITNINKSNIRDCIDKWNALDYNAVFIADIMSEAMNSIRIIRTEDIRVPIMGATGIDTGSFIEMMGSAAEGITMPTTFNTTLQTEKMSRFLTDYQKLYGEFPDHWAAQGYDTVMILCKAIETSGSAAPDKIAAALYEIKDYEGISGKVTCNSRGEIVGPDLYVKKIQDGKYIYIGKY